MTLITGMSAAFENMMRIPETMTTATRTAIQIVIQIADQAWDIAVDIIAMIAITKAMTSMIIIVGTWQKALLLVSVPQSYGGAIAERTTEKSILALFHA